MIAPHRHPAGQFHLAADVVFAQFVAMMSAVHVFVIPSEVEESRYAAFKESPRDPTTYARDDKVGKVARCANNSSCVTDRCSPVSRSFTPTCGHSSPKTTARCAPLCSANRNWRATFAAANE